MFRYFCLAFALASLAYSQEVTAGIYGVVQDATTAVVPGATVRARNLGTCLLYTSDAADE